MTEMRKQIPDSLLWMGRIDPYRVVRDDLTPEECVCVIDCMMKRRSVDECCEWTGLGTDIVASWYDRSDIIYRVTGKGK